MRVLFVFRKLVCVSVCGLNMICLIVVVERVVNIYLVVVSVFE